VRAVALVASCLACAVEIDSSERAGIPGVIYYSSGGAVRRIEPTGGGDRWIAGGDGHDAFVYPADRSRVFVVEDDDIDVAAPDGTSRTPLVRSVGVDWYPRASRGRVLFESSRASFRDLYVVSIEGGEAVRSTDHREGSFDADWSPDGRSIVFASSRYGQLDLFVATAAGGDVRRITQHPGDSVKPRWAGDLIAFLSGRDGEDDLFTVRPDGSDIENRTRSIEGDVTSFDWHPSGDALVVAVRRGRGRSQVHRIDLERGAERLSREGEDDSEPVFSPDGRYVALTRASAGDTNIHLMRGDGSGQIRLVGGAWLPRWLEVEGSSR
jgi:TolB protein